MILWTKVQEFSHQLLDKLYTISFCSAQGYIRIRRTAWQSTMLYTVGGRQRTVRSLSGIWKRRVMERTEGEVQENCTPRRVSSRELYTEASEGVDWRSGSRELYTKASEGVDWRWGSRELYTKASEFKRTIHRGEWGSGLKVRFKRTAHRGVSCRNCRTSGFLHALTVSQGYGCHWSMMPVDPATFTLLDYVLHEYLIQTPQKANALQAFVISSNKKQELIRRWDSERELLCSTPGSYLNLLK